MTTQRDQRAELRAASQERAETAARETAKQRQPQLTASATLETEDGGTVLVETEMIRPTTGDTPTNAGSGGSNPGGGSATAGGAPAGAGIPGSTAGAMQRAATDPSTAATPRTAGGEHPGRVSLATGMPPTTRYWGSWADDQTPPRQVIVREKARALKLTKFKGLDDGMPVTMWLKTVRAEVRRQASTMGVEWSDGQLYHEVASHLDGEAKRWFATVMDSVPPSEENINTLAGMLRAKYLTQRTTPEVVDLLNARRQMRGERLVEYAQSLREIGERGDVGESWLVNAFLKGMNSVEGATHVRGHRPQTLDEAVRLAVPHVGEYGEGYGVGLEAAMTRWDDRETQRGRGLLATAGAMSSQEQSGLRGNLTNDLIREDYEDEGRRTREEGFAMLASEGGNVGQPTELEKSTAGTGAGDKWQ
ncbi:Retrovirus Polyprotein [Phytophthora cinnamomi]|uniref:Retrovirus Polyprotein n=1 Tax=Phytophthora cinnamomi TaxID=4785 RepID=UPI00355AB292|nr:Retrovirus Polyprotein [Phytophthora cinnamomi]